jgi:hypothetical protein
MAIVENKSGTTFNLTSLKLGFGDLVVSDDFNQLDQDFSASHPAQLATASLVSFKKRSTFAQNSFGQNIQESNHVSNDGIEDFEFVDLGPKLLQEKDRFDILTLKDIPIFKKYIYELSNTNQDVFVSYNFKVPEGIHIPSGSIIIYNYNDSKHSLGSWLGETKISEKYQNDEVSLELGTTFVIKVQTIIKSYLISKSDAESYYEEEDNESAADSVDSNDEFSDDSDGDYSDDNHSNDDKDILSDFEDDKKDNQEPKFMETTIKLSLKNNSSLEPANIICKYPIITGKIINMSEKPNKIKNGFYHYNFLVEPLANLEFKLKIIYQI